MSAYLIERIEAQPRIDVEVGARVAAVHGAYNDADGEYLDGVTVATPDRIVTHAADGLFVFIGAEPRTSWAPGLLTDKARLHPHRPGRARRSARVPRNVDLAASSPPATSAPAASSASQLRPARARWPCSSSTATSTSSRMKITSRRFTHDRDGLARVAPSVGEHRAEAEGCA
jgi:hypothetical protein